MEQTIALPEGSSAATYANTAEPPTASTTPAPPRKLNRLSINGIEAIQLTAWFALATGLLEAGWYAVMKFGLGKLIFSSHEFYWAAPATQLAVAMLLGSPLIFMAFRTRACTEYVVAVIFGFLAVYNTALLVPNLHYLAELILALGAASQLARFIENHPGRILKFVKSTIWFLIVPVLAIWFWASILPGINERQTLATLPPAKKDAPNFLFIVLDTVTANAIELDSSESNTPNMQRLAKQGIAFRNAHSVSPWTLPSHATLMTSRYPHEMSSGWYRPLDDEFPTIGEWMQQQGYRTAGFVGNNIYASADSGIGRGFMHFNDYVFNASQCLLSTAWGRKLLKETNLTFRLGSLDRVARRRAPDVCDALVDWVNQEQTRPYFAFANLFDAHDPYLAPEEFQTYVPTTTEEKHQLRYWWKYDKTKVSKQQVKNEFTAYQNCMRFVDNEIGRMLGRLKEQGRLENTIVVITADHGEHFGDHELFGHGNSLYQAGIHVPLIIWSSAQQQNGIEVTKSVSNRDLPATFATFVAPEAKHPFHGAPLQRFTDDNPENDHETTVFAEIAGPSRWPVCGGRSPVFRGPMKAIVSGHLKYILNGDGIEELYDLSTDPGEEHNLIESIDQDVKRMLQVELQRVAGTSDQTNEGEN